MSLKDRLNATQKQLLAHQKIEEQPKYYKSNNEANQDCLGVLNTLLIDDDLNSIFVSGAKNIYINRKGKTFKSTTTFRDDVQLENLIRKNAQNEGIELNENNSYFKFTFEQGINVYSTLPPLSNVATMYIKCYQDKHADLKVLEEELSISKEISLVLETLCALNQNILISGNNNTLKTTLLSALSKKIPNNNRVIIIDSENEIKSSKSNCTTFDFSRLDENQENSILNMIINSNPEKLVINTNKDDLLSKIILNYNNKGLITSVNAQNKKDAIENLVQIILKNNQNLTYEKAKAKVLNTFDIIIQVDINEKGKRKITSISQINLKAENDFIQDIFHINYQQEHKSTGVVPLFFKEAKDSALPVSDSIFNQDYKHTYFKNIEPSSTVEFNKKTPNLEILKKFKKDLPTLEDKEIKVENNETDVVNIEDIENNLNDNNENI